MTAWALITAEAMKLRRTSALVLAAAVPLLAILLHAAAVFGRKNPPRGDAVLQWQILLQSSWTLFIGLFLPVLIAFEAACLANLEHSGKHWKQLFAYPIPRWSVFANKMLFCWLLACASLLIAAPGYVANVLLYSAVNGLGLAASIPWAGIFAIAGKACLASWLLIVAQTWISTRLAGIALPLGIGLAGLILGLMLIPITHGNSAAWFPWTLPYATVPASNPQEAHDALAPVYVGCLGGLLAAVFVCRDLARRTELV